MNDTIGMTIQNMIIAVDDDAIAIGTVMIPAAMSIISSSGLAMNAANIAMTMTATFCRRQTASPTLHFFVTFITLDIIIHALHAGLTMSNIHHPTGA